MSAFAIVLTIGIAMVTISILGTMIVLLRTADNLSRAVLADMIFYSMIAVYLIWSLDNPSSITYEIALLAAVLGGVLPTMSMARIITKGRR